MNKILKKQEFHQIGMLLKADCTYTNTPSESIELLADTHFTDSQLPSVACALGNNNGSIINKYINKTRIEYAIQLFRPYHAPGLDGILPIMLQKSPKYSNSSSNQDL